MNIPGHLAVAVIQHRLLNFADDDHEATALLGVASLFPDVVDKSIGYLFKLMPNGRHYAHSLFGLTLTTLFITLISGKRGGVIWSIGYLGHLLVDSQQMIPWFFPFKQYVFHPGGGILFHLPSMFKELGLLLIALYFHRYRR